MNAALDLDGQRISREVFLELVWRLSWEEVRHELSVGLQVTNDSVLVVLYKIVSHPAPDAGAGSSYLSPSNLIITSIVQNDLQVETGAPHLLTGRWALSSCFVQSTKWNSESSEDSAGDSSMQVLPCSDDSRSHEL